ARGGAPSGPRRTVGGSAPGHHKRKPLEDFYRDHSDEHSRKQSFRLLRLPVPAGGPAARRQEPERSVHHHRDGEEPRLGGTDCNRSEEHTSELQSHLNLVCRLLLEKKKKK